MKIVTLNNRIIQFDHDSVTFLNVNRSSYIENLLNYMIHNYNDKSKELLTTINRCIHISSPSKQVITDLITKGIKPPKDFTLDLKDLNTQFIDVESINADYNMHLFQFKNINYIEFGNVIMTRDEYLDNNWINAYIVDHEESNMTADQKHILLWDNITSYKIKYQYCKYLYDTYTEDSIFKEVLPPVEEIEHNVLFKIAESIIDTLKKDTLSS